MVASVRHRTRSCLNHSGVSSEELDEEELPVAPCLLAVSIVVCNSVAIFRKEVLANESADLVVAARREGLRNRPSDSAVLERIKARVPKPLIKTLVSFLSPRRLAAWETESSPRRRRFGLCGETWTPKRCVSRRIGIAPRRSLSLCTVPVPRSMGAGASTAKKKKAAAAAAAAAADSPKKVDDAGKTKAVDSGGDKVEKVAAEATAADKGDKVGKDDIVAPCNMLLLCFNVGLYIEAMIMHGNMQTGCSIV